MSEIRKSRIHDPSLEPVKMSRVEVWEGSELVSVAGFEVSFEESSPVSRQSRLWMVLKVPVLIAGFVCAVVLAVVGPIFLLVALGSGRPLDGEQLVFLTIVGGGTLLFAILYKLWTPPFRGLVEVRMTPADNRLDILRLGKHVATVPLSEVRGMSIEQHPGFIDAVVDMEADPKDKGLRWWANVYRQAESIYLLVGTGMTVSKVEAASVMGRKAAREVMAMRIRGALDIAWQAAMALKDERLEAQQVSALPAPPPLALPARRRRRGRLE